MIKIDIPGRDLSYEISHVVLDYNGTIAYDGNLIEGLAERFQALSSLVKVYIITADTYGTVRQQCEKYGVEIKTFTDGNAAVCKEEIVKSLSGGVMAVGNGYNDIPMLDVADLSVCVIDHEGTYAPVLSHVDIVTLSPLDALDLLLKPNHLKADFRN